MAGTKRAPRVPIELDEVGEISFGSTYMGTRRLKFIRSKDFVHRGNLKRITVRIRLGKGLKDGGTFSVQVALINPQKGRALLNHQIDEVVKIDPAGLTRAVQTAWREHLATIGIAAV